MSDDRDLTGNTYGKVKVIKRSETYKNDKRLWECVCECGNHVELSTAQLIVYGKRRDCGCGIAKKETATIRTYNNAEVLELEPSMLVITDLLNGRVIITAIDNAQHVSMTIAKEMIDKGLQRFQDEPMLKQWIIDSETFSTVKPIKANTIWMKVKTLISIKRDTVIIHAVKTGVN